MICSQKHVELFQFKYVQYTALAMMSGPYETPWHNMPGLIRLCSANPGNWIMNDRLVIRTGIVVPPKYPTLTQSSEMMPRSG